MNTPRLLWRAALCALLFLHVHAFAAIRVWDGSFDGYWTNGANWAGNGAPAIGDEVQFPAGALRLSNTNVFGAGRSFQRVLMSGSNYVIRGNSMAINDPVGFTANFQSGVSTFEPDLTFGVASTLQTANSNATLILRSDVSIGAFTLNVSGSGRTHMLGVINGSNPTFSQINANAGLLEWGAVSLFPGEVHVLGGEFWLTGSALPAQFIGDGGVMGGTGTYGQISLLGATLRPGTNGPGILTVRTNLTADATSKFTFRLNGTTAGSGYSQISLPLTTTTANLGSASLEVLLGFVPAIGDSFTLINKAGTTGVAGTFSGRSEGSTFAVNNVTFRITYDGGSSSNDVVITVVDATSNWASSSGNGSWLAATNWSGGVIPQEDFQLFFPAISGTRNTTNNLTTTSYRRVTLTDVGYSIFGNAFGLNDWLVNMAASGTNVINASVFANGAQVFSNRNAGSVLALNSVILTNGSARFEGSGSFSVGSFTTTTGAVTKFGSGTLFHTGGSSGSAPVLVAGGSLTMRNGDLTSSSGIIVSNNASLSGTGRVTTVNLKNGDIEVGEPTGRLIVNGALVATNGAIAFDLNGTNSGATADQLAVNGSINLSNATLAVNWGFDPPDGHSFIIISNDASDAVLGNFVGLTNGATFVPPNGKLRARIQYNGGDGNDVQLTTFDVSPGAIFEWSQNVLSSRWSNSSSWAEGTAPSPGDTLHFRNPASGTTRATNDFPSGTSFGKLRLVPNPALSGGNANVELHGNAIRLERGISMTNRPNDPHALSLFLPITLAGDQTFTNGVPNRALLLDDVDLAGRTLCVSPASGSDITFNGAITGTGATSRVTLDAPGVLNLIGGPHSYAGTTLISTGQLNLGSSLVSPIALSPGAVLTGAGGAGSLTSTGALVRLSSLTLTGALAFDAATRWTMQNNLSLIIAGGSVTLGGASLLFSNFNAPTQDASYTIINKTSAGAVSGTFNGLTNGQEFLLSGRAYRIFYNGGDGNDVVIMATNKSPILAVITNRTVNEHSLLTFTNVASDPDPANSLTFSLDPGAPAGAAVHPTNGVFTWIPSEAQGPGVFSITVRVTDNGNPAKSAASTFTVTVNDFDLPPAIGGVIPGPNVTVLNTNQFNLNSFGFTADAYTAVSVNESNALTLELGAVDPEVAVTNFTFTLLTGPETLTLTTTVSNTALVQWTPSELEAPDTNFALIRIQEAVGAQRVSTQALLFVTREVNIAPTVAPIAGTNVIQGLAGTIIRDLIPSDADFPPNQINFAFIGSSFGASITGGQFVWTPPTNLVGQFVFNIRATDFSAQAVNNTSLSTTQQFTILIGVRRVVMNTNDSGPGSLREAITQVNTNAGGGFIDFNISGAGPHRIRPLTALPSLLRSTVIDGYSQPGAQRNTLEIGSDAVLKIELHGGNVGTANGLEIAAANCVIRGLCLNGHSNSAAINMNPSASGSVVEGCFIGTDVSGITAVPNRTGLFVVQAADARVGGAQPSQRNVISGNIFDGIVPARGFTGPAVQRLIIENNLVGSDRTGTNALGNGRDGIAAPTGGVGGAGFDAFDCVVADNVIAANGGLGINFGGSNNRFIKNKIGVGADGSKPLGNASHGIELFGTGHDVGSTDPTDANLIAFNTGAGVFCSAFFANDISVLGNSIFSNGGLPIDLGTLGVTPNDAGDADSGANGLQNFPVLSSATNSGTHLFVTGTLQSQPNQTYRLEFFFSPVSGQAAQFIGSAQVSTDGSGSSPISVMIDTVLPGGFISATATDANGSTSEVSPSVSFAGTGDLTPRLRIINLGASVRLEWPSTFGNGFFVETNGNLSNPDGWNFVPTVTANDGQHISVTLSNIGAARFFRLIYQ